MTHIVTMNGVRVYEDESSENCRLFINTNGGLMTEYQIMEKPHQRNGIEEIVASHYPSKYPFEEYLKSIHSHDYHGTDDDMPDAFDSWFSELTQEDMYRFAEQALSQAIAIIKK